MTDKLNHDSTIASEWSKLTYPREYVSTVRHKMAGCVGTHHNAHVRIGVTGTGQKPCFRIVYKLDGKDEEFVFGSYWDNGTPLDKEDVLSNRWSTASMSYDEIDVFLKEKIGWKVKANN